MNDVSQWKRFWEDKGRVAPSDYEFDRGTSLRSSELETLSNAELLEFIAPKPRDMVFDAGCGTGANILLLSSQVARIVAMDYTESAIARCRRRLTSHKITNVDLMQGDITHAPLENKSADTVLCMSVFQYLNDAEAQSALVEFARILKPAGTLILHVKNLSSLYLSTLWLAKRSFLALGQQLKLEYFRPYRWYVNQLRAAGFDVVAYNSFNLLLIESMPQRLVRCLQRLEFRHRNTRLFQTALVRRHGSELKIKASLRKSA